MTYTCTAVPVGIDGRLMPARRFDVDAEDAEDAAALARAVALMDLAEHETPVSRVLIGVGLRLPGVDAATSHK